MGRHSRIDADTARTIRQALEAADYGNQGAVVDEWRQRLGVSKDTIYRAAKRAGFESGRATRADAGTRARDVTDEHCHAVVQTLHRRNSRKYTGRMSLHDALAQAERDGVIPRGLVSAGQVRRYMERERLRLRDFRAGTPHQEIAYAYPNQVQEVDFSAVSFWYLRPGRGDTLHRGDPQTLHTPGKTPKGLPVQKAVCVDMASGCIYVQFYQGHESAEIGLEFLHRAWSPKSDPTLFPFAGCPEHLLVDAGALGRSNALVNLARALDIDYTPGVPKGVIGKHGKVGHARARGGVENAMWIVEKQIEWRVEQERPATVAEANVIAERLCAELNNRAHSRFERIPEGLPAFRSRSECFAWFGRKRPLRLPPPFQEFMGLTQDPETRVVDGKGWFTFRGDTYRIDPRDLDMAEREIIVWPAPFTPGHVRVRLADGTTHTIRALSFDGLGYSEHAVPFGTYKAFPDTPAEAEIKARIRERDAAKAEVHHLPPKAEPIEAGDAAPLTFDELQAIDVLRAWRGDSITALELERLRQLPGWRDGRITEATLDAARDLLEPFVGGLPAADEETAAEA